MIHYIQLIPPKAEQKFRTMDILLCRLCCCMARLTPWASTLRVIVVYPLFIDTMQKLLLFCCWSSNSHVTRRRSTSLDFNSYGTQCPCFWIISNAFKCFEIVCLLISSLMAYQSSWGYLTHRWEDKGVHTFP